MIRDSRGLVLSLGRMLHVSGMFLRCGKVIVALALVTGSMGLAETPHPDAPATLEGVTVTGHPVPGENKMMGSYQQPEWTARRRFVLTPVYVQPDGQAEVELGFETAHAADGTRTRLFNQEIELGLPWRFQINLENTYQNFREGEPGEGPWHHDGAAVNVRYALADWGKFPLNPAVAVGWKFNSGAADAAEFQLLLGDELSPRWHWGANLFLEQQTGGDRYREQAVSAGLSYSLVNEKLNLGAEMKYGEESAQGTNSYRRRPLTLGPSVQWRPVDQIHLDLVPMWGLNQGAAKWEVFLFFGFEFGDGADDGDDKPKVEPASLRAR